MSVKYLKFAFAILSLSVSLSLSARPQENQPTQPSTLSTETTSSTVHHIKTVFLIVMENHNWTGNGSLDIKGNSEAPYLNYTLLPMASHAENYNNPPGNHPSLPNYLWLEAGSNFGIKADGLPSKYHQSTTEHLVTLLEKAGVSWKAYEESISGSVCPLEPEGSTDANGSQLYAPRHDPFVFFDDVTGKRNSKSTYCIDHIRPFSELDGDLSSNKVGHYNFITPNICDDMHDSCGGSAISHGDEWLKKNLPAILNSTAYRDGGAIFITFDEANKGDGPIPMIVLSPFAKGNGYSNKTYYTHGSTLRTIEEIFGVSPLIRNAASEKDLSGLFSVFP